MENYRKHPRVLKPVRLSSMEGVELLSGPNSLFTSFCRAHQHQVDLCRPDLFLTWSKAMFEFYMDDKHLRPDIMDRALYEKAVQRLKLAERPEFEHWANRQARRADCYRLNAIMDVLNNVKRPPAIIVEPDIIIQ